MSDPILKVIQDRVTKQQYVMTIHAVDEMEDDEFTIHDIEACILNGQIVEVQQDQETDESKYCIEGHSINGDALEVVVKLGPTKLVIITVYLK